MRYARLTIDHATGRPRGTAFVCFWDEDSADNVIKQYELLRAETVGANAVRVLLVDIQHPSDDISFCSRRKIRSPSLPSSYLILRPRWLMILFYTDGHWTLCVPSQRMKPVSSRNKAKKRDRKPTNEICIFSKKEVHITQCR